MAESDALHGQSSARPMPLNGVAAGDNDARVEIRNWLLESLTARLLPEDLPACVDDATGLLGCGIGLDSIEILALVGALEEAFDITVDDEDLDRAHFETVGSLVTFVQERLPS